MVGWNEYTWVEPLGRYNAAASCSRAMIFMFVRKHMVVCVCTNMM